MLKEVPWQDFFKQCGQIIFLVTVSNSREKKIKVTTFFRDYISDGSDNESRGFVNISLSRMVFVTT